jgi:nitrite reductase/ring-hydroxylating ferredoxin subunit
VTAADSGPAVGPARRSVVLLGATAGLGVAGIAGLAGCGSGAGSAGESSGSPSGAASAPGSGPPSGSASGGSSEDALIKLSSVPVGGSVKIGGTIVTRTGSNSVVGHSTTCTHQGCSVEPAGRELHCPCHGSRFLAASGAVLHGPAQRPLDRVGLVVKSGYVHLA